jgi:tetratricopeptide (TPR) repeat protein
MKQYLLVLLFLFCGAPFQPVPGQTLSSGQAHLDRALRLSNAYNWVDAAPEFIEAERVFLAEHNEKGAYQAQLGKMRSTIDRGGALPEVIFRLGEDLDTKPFLKSDLKIRMFCLIVKGDFDSEADHSAMARDWEEVRALAKQLGDRQWQNRAGAQLGIAAYYNADLEGARQQAGMALMGAHAMGDKPGEMLILAILANGLNFSKLYGQALPLADQSINLAKSTPEIGYPHVAYQAKLAALIGTGDLNAAQRLAQDMLEFARGRQGLALESAMLAQLGQISRIRGNQEQAISFLNEAIQIARTGGYLNTLAEAQNILTDIYLDRKDLKKAEVFASEAAKSAQSRGDFTALPERLAVLGRLQVAQGKYGDADQTFNRGAAFIDSMVGRSQSVLEKIALISSSSDLYRQQFGLVADQFQNGASGSACVRIVHQLWRERGCQTGISCATSAHAGAFERRHQTDKQPTIRS